MTYYNTNQEEGQVLEESNQKAMTQTQLVLKYFKDRPTQLCPRYYVELVLGIETQSASRALSDLTNCTNPSLEMMGKDHMVMGPKGKTVHCWRLAMKKDFNGQGLLF